MYRRHAAFTLIELMIVVAIIAIILAIAVPNLQRSRISAAEAAAVGALRSLHAEVGLYRARFGGWPADFGELQAAGYAQSFVMDTGSLQARRPGQPRLGAFLAFSVPKQGKYSFLYSLGDPLALGGSWTIISIPPDNDYRTFAINEAGRLFVTGPAIEIPIPYDP